MFGDDCFFLSFRQWNLLCYPHMRRWSGSHPSRQKVSTLPFILCFLAPPLKCRVVKNVSSNFIVKFNLLLPWYIFSLEGQFDWVSYLFGFSTAGFFSNDPTLITCKCERRGGTYTRSVPQFVMIFKKAWGLKQHIIWDRSAYRPWLCNVLFIFYMKSTASTSKALCVPLSFAKSLSPL